MSTSKKHPYYKTHIGEYPLHPETQMMSYGYDPFLSEGALKPPVFHTSTFVFETAQDGKSFFELAYGKRQKGQDEEVGLIYSRINNPNLEVLEDRLTLWDGAEKALSFSISSFNSRMSVDVLLDGSLMVLISFFSSIIKS